MEPLGDQHDRAAFSCGVEALDRYFHENVAQDISRLTAAAFVLTSNGVTVAGFYTLSSLSILGAELPPQLAKKLPSRSPIGVTLLGRMGVEQSLKGLGSGGTAADGCAASVVAGVAAGGFVGCGGRCQGGGEGVLFEV